MTSKLEACSPLIQTASSLHQESKAYDGAIVLVRRGSCSFQQKLQNVETAGGIGMLLINTEDELLPLATLDHEHITAFAVSIKQSIGERLITSLQEHKGDILVSVKASLSIPEQAWHRIRYLVTTNVPVVAYETYMDVIDAHSIGNVKEMVTHLLNSDSKELRHHQSAMGIHIDEDETASEWLRFFFDCAVLISENSAFVLDDVALHAAVAAAFILLARPPMDVLPPPKQASILLLAAEQLLEAGYYAGSQVCLLHVLHNDRLAATTDEKFVATVRCRLALAQFLQCELPSSLLLAKSCLEADIRSIPSLSVTQDNLFRLAAMEKSAYDLSCFQQPHSIFNGSAWCCRSQSHEIANLMSSRASSRSNLEFSSLFVKELYHSLMMMGVFLDELGSFNESLRFFNQAAQLCGDDKFSSLLPLHFRMALAVPIVFPSKEAILPYFTQMEAKMDALLKLYQYQQQQQIQQQEALTLNVSSLSQKFGPVMSVRPELSTELLYTITPPTMFIGYQASALLLLITGTDVLLLQRQIYHLRASLFPSLSSNFSHVLTSPHTLIMRKRRIGFISTWFRHHSVGKLLLGVIKTLDRTKFDVRIYRCVHFLRDGDEMTTEFQHAADHYEELPVGQDEAVGVLLAEELDVLIYPELGMDAWTVYLSHHRFARVQCVFWGHPITTGNPAIDYFISSEWFVSDFLEDDEAKTTTGSGEYKYHGSAFSEQMVLFRGLSTFFKQTLMKLHPDFDNILEGILTRDPLAYIVLLSSAMQRVWKEHLSRRLHQRFGQNYRRVLFLPTLPHIEFMVLLSFADVVLDPFPFGGGVTTLDALALGTPVVTLPSAQTVVQLAAGFLRYMNVTDGITRSQEEYVIKAVEIATNSTVRERIQGKLLSKHHVLYEDEQTIEDWNQFLAFVSRSAHAFSVCFSLMAVELKDLAPLLLKKERAGGDIDPNDITPVLHGGKAANARRKELVKVIENHPVLSDKNMLFRNHTERYNYGIKKAYHYVKLIEKTPYTNPEDRDILYRAMGEPLGVDVHRSMFLPTLENQADEEQQKKWLPLAQSFKILGAYAQTELGHGSNVQGIETTATYDKKTQEFIINSPTLTSRKWWPGGLGKTANHAIVHARLTLDGKDRGVQAFLVQLRSLEDHQPLPGIEVGDIGPKVGFNAVDNGYAAFHNVRIPRENMMMRYAKVLPDGTFVKPKSDKLVYLTMVNVRAYLILSFGLMMGKATTITTRFSAARVQGRTPDNKGEFQVLDYQNQQYALFPFIAISYAANFAGRSMIDMHDSTVEVIKSGSASFGSRLAELHAISSGLKAWLAQHVSDGIESCRRLCGGHGFTQSSNLAHLFAEIVGANTFEGTFDVLVQQHARYLLKVLVKLPYIDDNSRHKLEAQTSTSFLTRVKAYANPSLHCKAQKSTDFGNFELLIEAFEVRATRAILRLAKEMQATNNDGNACMVLMSRASTAHAELLLLSSFVKGINAIPAGTTRVAVANLCALFGSWLIVKSLGDFREDDYISSHQSELVRQYLVSLLPVVRKNCVLLTDAWDFSDFELNSTIGRYDGDIYRALVERAADEPLNKTQVAESYEKYLKPLIHSGL